MTKIRRAVASLTLIGPAIALLTGCGGNETPAGNSPSKQITTATTPPSSTTPSTSVSKPKVVPDAATIAKALQKASGGHIKSLWTYTEDTDPNNLIGRPGGYTSATFAYDNRVPDCKAKPDSMCGAQVEQFADEADAKRRLDYIAGIYKAAPVLGTEYLTVEGSTLLRVTGELKPSVNRAYVAALKEALRK
jgi:hypothetical protein